MLPPSFPRAVEAASAEGASRAAFANGAGATSMKWAALHEAAAAVCTLAGEDPEPSSAEVRNFPAQVRDANGWRRELAERGVDDLAALMQPGIAALLAVSARGIDPTSAARALWREFLAARAALLGILPSGRMGPPRKA